MITPTNPHINELHHIMLQFRRQPQQIKAITGLSGKIYTVARVTKEGTADSWRWVPVVDPQRFFVCPLPCPHCGGSYGSTWKIRITCDETQGTSEFIVDDLLDHTLRASHHETISAEMIQTITQFFFLNRKID